MTEVNLDWFTTTPEAVLRAEGMLTAFRENRIADIGAMLTVDYDPNRQEHSAVHVLVALIAIADRLANGMEQINEYPPEVTIRTATKLITDMLHAKQERNEKGEN